RMDAELARGRHAALVPELEAYVAEHPLRERLRGQLMLALYRCGRQADALEAYRDGRSLLVDELALDPSPALQRLERAILSQDPGLELAAPSPTSVATAPAPSQDPPSAHGEGLTAASEPASRRLLWAALGVVLAAAAAAAFFLVRSSDQT